MQPMDTITYSDDEYKENLDGFFIQPEGDEVAQLYLMTLEIKQLP